MRLGFSFRYGPWVVGRLGAKKETPRNDKDNQKVKLAELPWASGFEGGQSCDLHTEAPTIHNNLL